MTKKQLEKFVKTRNKSQHMSNLQFQIDASACGFEVTDLGDAKKIEGGYRWNTPHGVLIEKRGRLELLPK